MKCEGIFIFEVSKIFIRPVNKVFFLCYFKLFKSWKMIKFVFQIQYSRSPKKFQTCVMSYCMCVFKHLIPLCESRAGSVSENLIGSGALPVRWNDCQDCLISTVRSAEVKLLRMTTVQLIIPEKSKPFRWREDTTVKSGVARQVGKKANAHESVQTGNLMEKMVEFKSQIFFVDYNWVPRSCGVYGKYSKS